VRVGLLGPLVWTNDDGSEVRIAARKERAVLAFLTLRAGSVVQQAGLITALWGDDPPASAVKTLQTYISQLRKVLPEGVIETKEVGYRLAIAPGDVDVTNFESLLRSAAQAAEEGDSHRAAAETTEGLSLWRGEPLEDLADHPVGMAEAARLKELRRSAEERNFAARLALGEHAELIGDLETAVAADPFDAQRWEKLMVALYRSGREGDALRAYQRMRSAWIDDGLEPPESLKALERAILAHDLDANLPAAPAVRVARESPQRPSGNVTFVYTGVEGSSRLMQRLGPEFNTLLEDHRRILRSAVTAHDGVEFNTQGDGLFAAFGDAGQAIGACLDGQLGLAAHEWPSAAEVRAMMGIHTGIARPTAEGEYVSDVLQQAKRICRAGHGGQVLLSADTAKMVRRFLPPGATLVDRGSFMLNGFEEPERIHQLAHPELRTSFPPLRASPAQSHNLPDLRMSFVGRQPDFKAVEDLLHQGRLVTVVGPGGAGKTRLCVEVAARLATDFEGGVHLCDLSPLTDPGLVPAALAGAFAIRDSPGVDPLSTVTNAMKGRQTLLLMDSCEHVMDGVSAAVDTLLSILPDLRILASSRESLGVSGEQLWRLAPLAVPDPDAGFDAIRRSDAVVLFEGRARLVQPGFAVTEANAEAVTDICRQLEGLPLAIELVAAQVASLSPSVVAERLGDRPQILRAGSDRGSTRHRNLEATVDWSYQLLDEESRRLLRFLSVFANGFTLDAARAVSEAADPVAVLTKLVDKSLVVWDPDASRYRILETIRAFARTRLDEAGEADVAGARHLAWCAHLADGLKMSARTAGRYEAYDLFDRELDNFRVALVWAADHSSADGLRLAGAVIEQGATTPEAEALESRRNRRAAGPGENGRGSTGDNLANGELDVERTTSSAAPNARFAPDPLNPPEAAWEVVASADRAYFDRVQAESVDFPLVAADRRFRLTNSRATIGRRSASRGINPDIDLSAPPTDTGISHQHAVLLHQDDGTWAIIDPGSTNGVFINDSTEPLPVNRVTALADGDRIHLGAWTTLTIHCG
jgi:predicted ATPase/DNA-binding SARP family transcriptional activator